MKVRVSLCPWHTQSLLLSWLPLNANQTIFNVFQTRRSNIWRSPYTYGWKTWQLSIVSSVSVSYFCYSDFSFSLLTLIHVNIFFFPWLQLYARPCVYVSACKGWGHQLVWVGSHRQQAHQWGVSGLSSFCREACLDKTLEVPLGSIWEMYSNLLWLSLWCTSCNYGILSGW